MTFPLIAVCALGWIAAFCEKKHLDGKDIDEASCSSACGCGSRDAGCSSGEDRSFWANPLSMICGGC